MHTYYYFVHSRRPTTLGRNNSRVVIRGRAHGSSLGLPRPTLPKLDQPCAAHHRPLSLPPSLPGPALPTTASSGRAQIQFDLKRRCLEALGIKTGSGSYSPPRVTLPRYITPGISLNLR